MFCSRLSTVTSSSVLHRVSVASIGSIGSCQRFNSSKYTHKYSNHDASQFTHSKYFQSKPATPSSTNTTTQTENIQSPTVSLENESNKESLTSNKQSIYDKFLNRFGAQAVTADENLNRYKMVIPAVTTHICLGGIYTWSMFNGPLTHELGVVTSVAGDWSFSHVVPVFSTVVLCHGISGALFGQWTDKVGPRISLMAGGLLYGGGVMLSSVGVALHQLPLIYLGFGVFAGLGHGISYVSPISTLIKWFPDRRGFATGTAVMGLGGGAIAITPLIEKLLSHNFKLPTFISDNKNEIANKFHMISNDDGQHFININNNNVNIDPNIIQTISTHNISNNIDNGNFGQIVQITNQELAQSGFNETIQSKIVDNGWYLVDTIGNTGVSQTLFTLGAGYFTIITLSSMFLKLPHPSAVAFHQKNMKMKSINNDNDNGNNASSSSSPASTPTELVSLSQSEALRTPQFWLLSMTLFSCATAGMGVISCAKTIMTETFGQSLPHIVTASFASTYVMAISGSNLLGRLGWGNISDKIGRFSTFAIFGIVGSGLYAVMPSYIHVSSVGILPLVTFYGSTLCLFSFFGGGFATIPAYIADTFGPKNVGALQGKLMLATAGAGICGPLIVTKLRRNSLNSNIHDISEKIWNIDNGITFDHLLLGVTSHDREHASHNNSINNDKIDQLIENNTLTIQKLMNSVEKIQNEMGIDLGNIVDPTPYLYDSTMYAMSGVMATCALANYAARKCKPTKAQMH